MPRSISKRQVASRPVTTRRVASERSATTSTTTPYVTNYGVGSYVWMVPQTGRYRVVQWAGGGSGSANSSTTGGGGGGHAQTSRLFTSGQTVSLVVGDCGQATTATFPDGLVVVANPGADGNSGGTGGTATGGDINITGAARSGAQGGAAGGFGSYRGAPGGTASPTRDTPGAGGVDLGGVFSIGGAGLLLIVRES
jgi:hypothetical protein